MEFRRLTEGGSDLYQRAMELYEISFPVFEQREPESQIEIMGHEEYRFHLIYDEETNTILFAAITGPLSYLLCLWLAWFPASSSASA